MGNKSKIQEPKIKIGKVWTGLLGLLAVVIGTQLIVSSILTGTGEELAQLEGHIARLSRENRILKEELTGHSSLSKIASESTRLELAKPDQVMYLDLSQPVAALPQ